MFCIQLGGIILPHPSQCRMSRTNLAAINEPVDLPDTELFDYPSVGQIAQALTEQNIISIFLTTQDNETRNIYDVRKLHLNLYPPFRYNPSSSSITTLFTAGIGS